MIPPCWPTSISAAITVEFTLANGDSCGKSRPK
jgi:hypothetical protein